MKSRTILGFGVPEQITCSMIGSTRTLSLCGSTSFLFLIVLSMRSWLITVDQATEEWYTGAVLLMDEKTDSESP